LGAIGIYRKTGPTKSTVLGPGPPPWDFYKIYRFSRFFVIFGPSIEPEKPSPKSASTANPPQKVIFIGSGINFVIILVLGGSFLIIHYPIYQHLKYFIAPVLDVGS
jgi:hypothetical protein